MTWCCMHVLMCVAVAGLSPLELRLSLDGDTFLPLEPVYVELTVTNPGHSVVEMPVINDASVGYVFDFQVMFPDGRAVLARPRIADLNWPIVSLQPGDSTHAERDLIEREIESPMHLQAGTYEVHVRRGSEKSDSHVFVIREPEDAEMAALLMYQDLLYYRWTVYWNRPNGPELLTPAARIKDKARRVEDLARKIAKSYLKTPYGVMAELELAAVYHRRLHSLRTGTPQIQKTAWADSVRSVYRRALAAHLNSRIAEYALRRTRLPEVCYDSLFLRSLLEELASNGPGTRVGKEAARQLRELNDRSGGRN